MGVARRAPPCSSDGMTLTHFNHDPGHGATRATGLGRRRGGKAGPVVTLPGPHGALAPRRAGSTALWLPDWFPSGNFSWQRHFPHLGRWMSRLREAP